jgi:hypothetical protein
MREYCLSWRLAAGREGHAFEATDSQAEKGNCAVLRTRSAEVLIAHSLWALIIWLWSCILSNS